MCINNQKQNNSPLFCLKSYPLSQSNEINHLQLHGFNVSLKPCYHTHEPVPYTVLKSHSFKKKLF